MGDHFENLFTAGPRAEGAIDVLSSRNITGSGNTVSPTVGGTRIRVIESPGSSVKVTAQ